MGAADGYSLRAQWLAGVGSCALRLLLVRHGETDLNRAGMFVGQKDVELNAQGRKQAENLRRYLAGEKIDAAYCSDLKRASLTARIVLDERPIHALEMPELREIDYGEVDGMTFDEIKSCYPALAQQCVTWSLELDFPGGENIEQFSKRISSFLDKLNKHGQKDTILIVSHGGALRFMTCALLGLDLKHWRQLRIDLASVTIVETYPDIAILNCLNDTSYLKELT
jgi:alpha-ribazole phosphatase